MGITLRLINRSLVMENLWLFQVSRLEEKCAVPREATLSDRAALLGQSRCCTVSEEVCVDLSRQQRLISLWRLSNTLRKSLCMFSRISKLGDLVWKGDERLLKTLHSFKLLVNKMFLRIMWLKFKLFPWEQASACSKNMSSLPSSSSWLSAYANCRRL